MALHGTAEHPGVGFDSYASLWAIGRSRDIRRSSSVVNRRPTANAEMGRFGGHPLASLASTHPDPGAGAPALTTRIRIPSRVERKAPEYRAAGEVAMVATALMFPVVAGGRGFESRPLRCRQLIEQETLNLLVRALTRRTTNQGHRQRKRSGDRPLPRREGFEPSQRLCHSPLKAMTALSEQRIFSPLLAEPPGHRPFTAVTGVRIPLGTPLGARRSL